MVSTVIHGDCIEEMAKMSEGSIDLTVTSPPYDNLRTYSDTLEWNESVWKDVIKGLYRVTKQGGVVVWVVGDATVKGSETGTSFKQALYFKECGFNLHDTMIYSKPNFSAVGALATRYAPTFEYMFILVKGKISTFNPIKDRKCLHGGKKITGTVRQKDGTMKDKSTIGNLINKYGQRYNVWNINPQTQKGHPAPFPDALANDHIVSWSNRGDLVFDPFCGSGTTGKMAKINNRDFIGCDKVKEYCDIAIKRIKNTEERLF